mmetsp:Transcript_18055/g.61359  ORF Transcript_18055/g.61359 Transcript_18055/m.61359 type:complete len:205 (+) Transcript_18055:542-1156(+)
MAWRTQSQSTPHESTARRRCCIMSPSCACTSSALRMALACTKWSEHHAGDLEFWSHCWYTLSRVRWSLSGTKNFSRAASLSSSRSLGRKKTPGTESMDTTTSTSAAHCRRAAKMSILARGGSRGNSTMSRPRGVSAPVLSSAPRTQSWYMELRMFSCGGGSRKSKASRSSTPRLLSRSTTFPRFVRWISGTWSCSSSSRNWRSV